MTEKVYIVYEELGIEGINEESVRVFEHKRDAASYYLALKSDVLYPDYTSVEILERHII